MDMLSAAAILGANDLEIKVVDVAEWKGKIGVRVLSCKEREAFEKAAGDKDPQGLLVLLVSLAACDSQGRRLFTPAQVDALAEKSCKALYRVYKAATELNKIDSASVDDAEGESAAAPSI